MYSVERSIEDIDNNIKRATEKLSFLSKFTKAKKEENEWKVLHHNSIRGETREIDEKIENLLSEFSLTEQRKTLAHSLSGGQKKKVAICRALIGDCRIMVLDEPLSNIDPITIEMIKDLIVKLQLTRSITIIISDHAFENVLQIADDIKILSDGYILSEGPPSSVDKDVRAREKYFGTNY